MSKPHTLQWEYEMGWVKDCPIQIVDRDGRVLYTKEVYTPESPSLALKYCMQQEFTKCENIILNGEDYMRVILKDSHEQFYNTLHGIKEAHKQLCTLFER